MFSTDVSGRTDKDDDDGEVAKLLRLHPLTDMGIRLLEKHVPRDFWLPPLLRDAATRRVMGLTPLTYSAEPEDDVQPLQPASRVADGSMAAAASRLRGSAAAEGDQRKAARS